MSPRNRAYAPFFRMAQRRAEQFMGSPWKVARLVYDASRRSENLKPGSPSGLRGEWSRWKALLRMLSAWTRGSYRNIPARTLVYGIGALVYFLNPIDAVADFLPVIGLVDDAAVIGLVLRAIRQDVEKFLEWEEIEGRTVEVEDPAAAIS